MNPEENKTPEGAEPQAAPVEVDESGNVNDSDKDSATEAPATDEEKSA